MTKFDKREIEFHKIYGSRDILSILFEFMICSWRGHRFKKDYRNNQRCQICYFSESDQ